MNCLIVGALRDTVAHRVSGAVKQLGLSGKPNANQPHAVLPAEVDDRLLRSNYIDAVSAVRDVHEAIASGGESRARLLRLLWRGTFQLLALLPRPKTCSPSRLILLPQVYDSMCRVSGCQ